MTKKIILIVIIILISVSIISKKYTVGVEDLSYYPFYNTEDKNYSGILKDIMEEFGTIYGYEFEFLPLPVKRLFWIVP